MKKRLIPKIFQSTVIVLLSIRFFCLLPTAYCLVSSFLFCFRINAQENFSIQPMVNVQQRMYANPALVPKSKVNIGLPVISSVYLSVGHSGFTWNELHRRRADDSSYFDYTNAISKMSKNNFITFGENIDLFSFGFRIKRKNYFSFNATQKGYVRFRYPKDFFQLINELNYNSMSRTLNFNFGLDAILYNEYGLSYTRTLLNDKLKVGGRFKLLQGFYNLWTERSDLTMFTDSTKVYDLTFSSDIMTHSSGLSNPKPEVDLLSFQNRGFGLDLGATFQLTEKWSFNASIVDMGYIKWQKDIKNIFSKNPGAKVTFSGMDLTNYVQDSAVSTNFNKVADSLSATFALDSSTAGYTNFLVSQYNLGAKWQYAEDQSLNGLVYWTIFDKSVYPAFSLCYSYTFRHWFNFVMSYSIYNRSYFNLGAGMQINLWPIQWYLVSDNVLAGVFPQDAKYFNVRTGINLTFGRKDKPDKDKDGIIDELDKCPDEPGSKELNGCPDKDGDGIVDKEDKCPNEKGTLEFAGCPDRDGDKIIDMEDKCPDEAGVASAGGCPDRDNDTVLDKEDDCPDDAGIVEKKGCPDRDKDDIIDKDDACPDEKGAVYNKGCPVKLHATKGNDTLRSIVMSEKGDFDFGSLTNPNELLFLLQGEDPSIGDEVKVVIDSESKIATKERKGVYKLPAQAVTLYMLNKGGDTLAMAMAGDGGVFVFDRLPGDDVYFALDGAQDMSKFPDIQVLAEGELRTARKTMGHYFQFRRISPEVERLYIISDNNDTLGMAVKNADGFFVFDKLPSDKNISFALLGAKDVAMVDNVKILVEGNPIQMAKKGSDAKFRFENLQSDQLVNLSLKEAKEVEAVLEAHEKTVVKSAFRNLEFESGSDRLKSASQIPMNELATLVAKHPDWALKVGGHTDSLGNDNANLVLSKKRAEAVKRYLVSKGVRDSQIITLYFGRKYPIAENSTSDGRQKNRRVEFFLIEGKTAISNTQKQVDIETPILVSKSQSPSKPGDVVYKVQIAASNKPISIKPSNFKGLTGVEQHNDKGVYKYMSGKETNYDAALVHQAEVRKKYPEAFIVPFHKNKKITVKEAIDLQSK